jgi:hypothetical protein
LERSAINPAPDVSGDYSSADEDEGTVPSPGGGDDDDDEVSVDQEVITAKLKIIKY